MRKLGLVVVILAFIFMSNLSSDTSVVGARQTSGTISVSVPLRSAGGPRAPLAIVSLLNGMVPVHEPTSLFLLGGGLISAGLFFRRRLRH